MFPLIPLRTYYLDVRSYGGEHLVVTFQQGQTTYLYQHARFCHIIFLSHAISTFPCIDGLLLEPGAIPWQHHQFGHGDHRTGHRMSLTFK
jgi:hypothetical protein